MSMVKTKGSSVKEETVTKLCDQLTKTLDIKDADVIQVVPVLGVDAFAVTIKDATDGTKDLSGDAPDLKPEELKAVTDSLAGQKDTGQKTTNVQASNEKFKSSKVVDELSVARYILEVTKTTKCTVSEATTVAMSIVKTK